MHLSLCGQGEGEILGAKSTGHSPGNWQWHFRRNATQMFSAGCSTPICHTSFLNCGVS